MGSRCTVIALIMEHIAVTSPCHRWQSFVHQHLIQIVFLTSGAGSDLALSCCSVPSPSASACPTCMNVMHTKTLICLLFIQRFMSVPKRHSSSSAPAKVLPYASAWLPGSTSEQEQRFEGSTCWRTWKPRTWVPAHNFHHVFTGETPYASRYSMT